MPINRIFRYMKRGFFTALTLMALCLATIVLTVTAVRPQVPDQPDPDPALSTVCAIQPETSQRSGARTALTRPASRVTSLITLERFRQRPLASEQSSTKGSTVSERPYTPREEIALIDPTNYGDRYLKDVNGNPASLNPIIVLHETVGSARSTINYFQTPHPRDEDQVSYHTLLRRDGTVVYLVPPDKRAFGAGNSVFRGPDGLETVKTNPVFPGSVNNFAYHISLETPSDGNNNSRRHSGYTKAQYQSLAWLVAQTGVPVDRITTHQAVDRSRSRMDPRSFSDATFLALLDTFPKTTGIAIRCTEPPAS